MTDTEHATLTGAFLHEPKGADTAVANRVYITDGLGSGAWNTVGLAQMSTTGIFPTFLHVRDEKASGTDGGTFSSGAWRTRTLNTIKTNTIVGASVTANQITLPAGTYYIEAAAPSAGTEGHVAKLRNITDSSDTIIGIAGHSQNEGDPGDPVVMTCSFVNGRFTIAGTKVFELQHRCANSKTGYGFGTQCGFGVVEVYAEVMIWTVTSA